MYIALLDGVPSPATSKSRGTCPECGGKVIGKQGLIKIRHWAHHHKSEHCLLYKEQEGIWHLKWKELAYKKGMVIEVPFSNRNRRADIYDDKNKMIYELQHSNISKDIVIRRCEIDKQNGLKTSWIFDFCGKEKEIKIKSDFFIGIELDMCENRYNIKFDNLCLFDNDGFPRYGNIILDFSSKKEERLYLIDIVRKIGKGKFYCSFISDIFEESTYINSSVDIENMVIDDIIDIIGRNEYINLVVYLSENKKIKSTIMVNDLIERLFRDVLKTKGIIPASIMSSEVTKRNVIYCIKHWDYKLIMPNSQKNQI